MIVFAMSTQVNQFLELKNSNQEELLEEKFRGARESINVGKNDVKLVFVSKPRLMGFAADRG
jgi:hypothetical protein